MNEEPEREESGSDELLSDDSLRLPDSANILVRLHAVRAWLSRRRDEAAFAAGKAALAVQEITQQVEDQHRPRRRLRQSEEDQRSSSPSSLSPQSRQAQVLQLLAEAQEALEAFDEAHALLEECIDHTQGERVLVEYYLLIEQLLLEEDNLPHTGNVTTHSHRYDAFTEVLRRIEHVGIPDEA